MGVVRIDDKLQAQIKQWIKIDKNKFIFPSLSAFVNQAIYEKLNEITERNEFKKKKKGSNDVKL